ncbi:fic family toxin-antitoxin system, toxin component [Streptomyces lydicus]|uniref:fic family toxin-antitoxin system, toxin component n=1 Tax=Streptomyces lydicus TaxID=47763 RepID=UPI003792843C
MRTGDLHIDETWVLQVAELAGASAPAVDDYSLQMAACARHRGALLGERALDGPYARAAALVHTLGRCRWLERSNLAVAAATGVMYLEASGISVKPTNEDAAALRDLLLDSTSTAARVRTVLRTWPTAS